MRRFFSALLFALVVLTSRPTSRAWAQAREAPPPTDVSSASFDDGALPSTPSSYERQTLGDVRWDHPSGAVYRALVADLSATVAQVWPRIERELGRDVDDALVIRLARNPDEMAALAPPTAPPPRYASGVAYPAAGLILLTLSAPETWSRPDLPHVLAHELSHVALHRAVDGRPVPRWFAEGLAIHQARERVFDRTRVLWEASAFGTIIPLSRLSQAFPERAHEVDLAYAESADVVEWLAGHGDGRVAHVPQLLGRIARGRLFDEALSQTWSEGPGALEAGWRESLRERFALVPLVLGTGLVWGAVALLVVAAWWRRRATSRATLARWAVEEAADDARRHALEEAQRRLRAAVRARIAALAPSPVESRASATFGGGVAPLAAGATVAERIEDAATQPSTVGGDGPDETLPTVVYDGTTHTLH